MADLVVRKVTRKVYDSYNVNEYSTVTDSLNPLNPTVLESQLEELTVAVGEKLKNAYDRAGLQIGEETSDVNLSTTEGLQSALDRLIKNLKDNPLRDLMTGYGLPGKTFLLGDPTMFDNPFTIDCNGIDTEVVIKDIDALKEGEEDGGKDEGELGNDGSGNLSSADASGKSFTITYENVSQVNDSSILIPKTFTKKDKKIFLPSIESMNQVVPEGYKFAGWYKDSSLSSRVVDEKLNNPQRDVTVYAYIAKSEDITEDPNGDKVVASPPNIAGEKPDNCAQIELEWLKIILVILNVAKTLIKILVIVYNVAMSAAEIAKDAELCWINPPSCAHLIAYVMQKASAIIFQLVGMLLMYLWKMLNLDCVSTNTTRLLNQINAILAGISDQVATVTPLACQFADNTLTQKWDEAMNNLREEVKKANQDFQDQWTNLDWSEMLGIDELGVQWNGLKDKFLADPLAFISDNMVPSEIKSKLMDIYKQMSQSKTQIQNISKEFSMMTKNEENRKQGEDKKGLSMQVING